MDEEQAQKIEDSIEDIPQEVRDFIFGDGLKTVKEKILDQIDDPEQKIEFSNMLMLFLLGGKTAEDLVKYIDTTLSVSPEKKLAIKSDIQNNIVDEIIAIVEANQEIDEEIKKSDEKPVVTILKNNTPAPLTSLTDRLKQATIAPSVKRDYSPAPIDPYHEPIDNE
jgi:hypothetical protein